MSDSHATRGIQVHQSREPGRNFTLYRPDELQSIFVDGIAGLVTGTAVSHLEFFVTTDMQQDTDPKLGLRETREIKLRVTMPTLQLLEGYANLLTALQAGLLDLLDTANKQYAAGIAEQIARVKAIRVS